MSRIVELLGTATFSCLSLLLVASLFVGCAAGPSSLADRDLHPTLSSSAYIEDGQLLALMVDTRVAGLRDKSGKEFVPLEIGVVNKGMESLTVTLESFSLIDEAGRRYPAVRGAELRNGYGSVDVDRRLGGLRPFLLGRFQTYQFIDSHLTESFDQPLELEQVYLPRYSMTSDMVYFPRPEEGARDQQLTLLLDVKELEESIVLRFKVS